VYVIPIIALAIVVAISAAWSPVFALVIAVPLLIGFFAYVGLSRRSHQEVSPPSGAPESGEGSSGGAWGERRT
jgi:hypothetical protein